MFSSIPWVYSIAVQQGNIVTQTMVDQLQPNMTKKQVLYVMGSPMLTDIFHANRWDYIYANKTIDGNYEQKNLSLFFSEDGHIIGIQGDFKPSDKPVKVVADKTVDVPKRNLDETIWGTIVDYLDYDKDHTQEEKAKETSSQASKIWQNKGRKSDPC